MNNNILLETGTGEVEILEFSVNGKFYGINVIKVKEVIESGNLTKLPECNKAIAGLILCRNEILTLVDLKYILDREKSTYKKSKVIVCEFNKVKVAFSIDNVVAVHRIKWDKIMKPDDIASNPLVIGNIILKDKVILLLDFEKIITDINPKSGISEEKIVNLDYKDRSNAKIILADDSSLIRRLLKETLNKSGFTNLKLFEDGKQTLDYLKELANKKGDSIKEYIDLIITDIEMPQMDGHTLTRKIKEDPILKEIPVIIFSSLITDELKHKGKTVGADAQLSKPEIGDLVDTIDSFLEKN